MFRKLKALSTVKKMVGVLLVFVALAVIFGNSPQPPRTTRLTVKSDSSSGQVQGDSTAVSNAAPTAQVTTKTITETQTVPFQFVTQDDANLPKGQSQIITPGVDGSETLTYKVTYTDDQQTDKQLLSTVTTPAVNQVTAIGTYVAPVPKSAPAPPSSCYPLTDGGNCYEPGEYCRETDHGLTGVAGDGKTIICADNDGWRWEPR